MLTQTLIVAAVVIAVGLAIQGIGRMRRGRIDRPPRGSNAHQRALALEREARYADRDPGLDPGRDAGRATGRETGRETGRRDREEIR